MKRALCIGASGGIGSAVVSDLWKRGYEVETLSRTIDGFDITHPASVEGAMGSLRGPFELVFIATGILSGADFSPEKSLSAIDADQMAEVFAANCIGPGLVLSHLPRLLTKSPAARIGVLSARVGSIGDNRIGGWHSYRASKAALNQVIRGAAIELGRTHKGSVCVALHPGTVATPFTAKYASRHKTVPAGEAAENLLDVLTGLTPEHTGGFFDYAGNSIPW